MPTTQETKDTITLLQQCDAGTKMAVASIRQVLDDISGEELRTLLQQSLREHEELGNKLHDRLLACGAEGKEPSPMGKFSSWFSTNVKLMMDKSDRHIASLMTDGCHMGVKGLSEDVNRYRDASPEAVHLCTQLITLEQRLADTLRPFL